MMGRAFSEVCKNSVRKRRIPLPFSPGFQTPRNALGSSEIRRVTPRKAALSCRFQRHFYRGIVFNGGEGGI